MNNSRVFHRADWIAGAIVAILSFAAYVWTAAPSVTLLDSGEFILAAQHFGVPHPTGYPLWTLLAWLFQLLPLGNVAWELAIFSGLCGALAVGLAAMLIRNAGIWILATNDPAWQRTASIVAIAISLVFAFSFSMWSQAVIVEVYTLHALLVGLYLASLYFWIRNPHRLAGLYWSFFLLTLAFSNHQLVLVFAVIPLQFLIVLLLRRDLFWDLFLAVAVCALIAYLAFAMLANDPIVIRAAIRLTWLVATILALGLILKRGRLNWRLTAFIPLIVVIGLLPYAYMPIASATNPPMNWGYTRTPEGFFYSFNRSQYKGSLSEQSLRALSKILGVAGREQPVTKADDDTSPSTSQTIRQWSAFFWSQLVRSFSPLGILFFAIALLGTMRRPMAVRVWIYVLILAFIGAGFVQPVLDKARIDNAGWWVQMPYHTYTNLIFALLAGIGALLVLHWLATRSPRLQHAAWAFLILPLWPVFQNHHGASQRNNWLGWQYGHDMLRDLPQGSVLFGGTDPGRFIPTYMILGESTLPRKFRIDPDFDRRDLYILTQNGLADALYLSYIRDHYSSERPRVKNAFEKWLERDRNYPADPLILPTPEEMQAIRKEAAARIGDKAINLTGKEVSQAFHGAVAEWIFQRNKDKHPFFVEESYPMTWSYPYAIPDGLLYRINPEPLEKLPPEVVQRDMEFWTNYIEGLKSNPVYRHDFDAQRSFAKLRLTGGNIYAHRKMDDAARVAYLQALDLWPGYLDAIISLSQLDWKRGDYDEPVALFEAGLALDPENTEFVRLLTLAKQRREMQGEIDGHLERWRTAPTLDTLNQLVTLYSRTGAADRVEQMVEEGRRTLGDTPQVLFFLIQVAEANGEWERASEFSEAWTKVDPQSPEAFYRLSRAQFAKGDAKASIASLAKALNLGGVPFRERLFRDPIFEPLKNEPAFNALMVAPPPAKDAGSR